MQAIEGAVVAAAGLGSRLGRGMPKCMIEVGGISIIDRLLSILKPRIPNIRIVVGYREELIIQHCATYHRNVIIARNPEFHNTNTAKSLSIGAQGIRGKTLFIDGDLILNPESMNKFLDAAAIHSHLIGLTEAKSEHAVFASQNENRVVSGFSRTQPSRLEWANFVAGPNDLMDEAEGFIFERLVPLLPLPGQVVDLAEVDTVDDLAFAERFVTTNDCTKP